MNVSSPDSQNASLRGLGGEIRNFPLVRGKFAFHVHSVVIDDSGRGEENFISLSVAPCAI